MCNLVVAKLFKNNSRLSLHKHSCIQAKTLNTNLKNLNAKLSIHKV